jgi:hypothetical protein
VETASGLVGKKPGERNFTCSPRERGTQAFAIALNLLARLAAESAIRYHATMSDLPLRFDSVRVVAAMLTRPAARASPA